MKGERRGDAAAKPKFGVCEVGAGFLMCHSYVHAAINQRLGAFSGLMPRRGAETSENLVQFLGLSGASPYQKTAQDAALDRPIASLARFLTRRS